MDIRLRFAAVSSGSSLWYSPRTRIQKGLKPGCSRRDPPQQNGDNGGDRGDKRTTDWDKAWSSFKKRGKKNIFSQFSDKYVTWNPTRSNYPLSEEIDPIKRTEKSNLMLWTSPTFTLVVAILIVTFLLVYTIIFPLK